MATSVVQKIANAGGVGIPVSLTTSMGATTTEGILLGATNTATAGAQVFSPSLHFQGSGWKTNATAAAVSCDWRWEVKPVQGASTPSNVFVLSGSNDGGSTYNEIIGFDCTSGQILISANGVTSLQSAVYARISYNQMNFISSFPITWGSSASNATAGVDTGLSRVSAGVVGVGTGAAGSFAGTVKSTTMLQESANGAQWIYGQASELLTISTAGLTTDTTANLLPADSIIEAVVVRITTTISGGGVATYSVGDPTTATRFRGASAVLAAGSTLVDIDHWSGAVATLAAGPSQASAAKVRITCAGGTPTAGAVRITVFYRQFVAPTS